MDNVEVEAQELLGVSAVAERAAVELSSEPSSDAMSLPGVPNVFPQLPTKPATDSGVVDAVAVESAIPVSGLCLPVPAYQRARPVHQATETREVGNDAAMARHAAGDQAAFAELYDGLAPLVMAYLRRRTHDRKLVEDLVQETFLGLHLHRGRDDPR
jgi:hypothetical protein